MFLSHSSHVRYLGGASHINNSVKSIFHYQVAEVRSGNKFFYGVGLTTDAAKNQAEEKVSLAQKYSGKYLEFLTGKPPCPAEVYIDPLPSKDRINTPGGFLCDLRLTAFVSELKEDEHRFRGFNDDQDPRANAIREFFVRCWFDDDRPNDRFRSAQELFQPYLEYWDPAKLEEKPSLVLDELLEGADIMHGRKETPTENSNPPVYEYYLRFLSCNFQEKAATEEKALESLSRSALIWLRKKLLDLLLFFPDTIYATAPFTHKISDAVTKIVCEKYSALQNFIFSQPEVRQFQFSESFAAVVLQQSHQYRLVTLACGSGTVLSNVDIISRDSAGFLLKDFHAEILALRALKLYLYDQVEVYFNKDPKKSELSIFVKGCNGSIVLKPGHAFHFFVSHKPCGHPEMIDPMLHGETSQHFRLYEKKGFGQQCSPLDTKESCTNLKIMSCCDKIQKRCFLGVQGALLSQIICPVYLGAVIVGLESVFRESQENQFVIHSDVETGCRKSAIEKPTLGYQVVSPVLSSGKLRRNKDDNKANGKAVCYYSDSVSGKSLFEFLDPESGRQMNGSFSLLCKRALFLRFRAVLDNITELSLPPTCTLHPRFRGTYLDCKSSCIDYNTEKEYFSTIIKDANPGVKQIWIKKNALFEKFCCTIEMPPKYSDYEV